jgi:hypothetical protein
LFRARANRGCPVGTRLLPRASTERNALAVRQFVGSASQKRRKALQRERSRREGCESGKTPPPSETPAIPQAGPLACETKCNSRVKRSDPWHRANALPKAMAVPVQAVKTRTQVTSVSLPGLQVGARKRQSKRAKRPHSKSCRRKALDGPATRPKTPLAVENSVGKLAAIARLMPARERECSRREGCESGKTSPHSETPAIPQEGTLACETK